MIKHTNSFDGKSGIPGVPDVDCLDIADDGDIYLHMTNSMTPEQLQLIVDFSKKIREESDT